MAFAQAIIVRVGADISAYQAQMARVVSGAKATALKLRASFAQVGRGLQQAGIGIASTFGIASALSIKAASSFEKGLAEVNTLLRLNAEDLKKLGEQQRALALEFGVDQLKSLKTLYAGISDGIINVANATEVMTVINKAAAAGLVDTTVAGEAIGRVMNAYAKEALSAQKASDFLFMTAKEGSTNFRALAPQIGKIAGTFAAASQPVEELGAALATVTKVLKTEEAVVALNQLALAFIKPAQEAKEAAAAMGIELSASALATKKLSGVMAEIGQRIGVLAQKELAALLDAGGNYAVAMDTMAAATGIQAEKLATLFPNVRALRAALALMSNEGRTFTEKLAAMQQMTGSTGVAFSEFEKTSSFAFGKATTRVKDLGISIGKKLMPVARKVLEGLDQIIDRVSEWIKQNPELASSIGKWVLQLSVASVLLLPLAGLFSIVTGALGILGGAFKLVATLIMGVLVPALNFLMANPLVALVAGIAALAVLVVKHWDTIVAVIGSAVEDVGELFGLIGEAWDELWDGVKELWNTFAGWFGEKWDSFWTGISDFFGDVWDWIVGFFEDVGEAIRDAAVQLWDWIKAPFVSVGEWVADKWEAIWTRVRNFFGGVADWIREKWEALTGWIEGVLNWIGEAVQNVGRFFTETIPEVLGFQRGGLVMGPAGIDRVPAVLTQGEFVVNAEATRQHRGILELMNAGLLSGREDVATPTSATVNMGGVNLSFPSVQRLDRAAARMIAEELDALASKGINRTGRRGQR